MMMTKACAATVRRKQPGWSRQIPLVEVVTLKLMDHTIPTKIDYIIVSMNSFHLIFELESLPADFFFSTLHCVDYSLLGSCHPTLDEMNSVVFLKCKEPKHSHNKLV